LRRFGPAVGEEAPAPADREQLAEPRRELLLRHVTIGVGDRAQLLELPMDRLDPRRVSVAEHRRTDPGDRVQVDLPARVPHAKRTADATLVEHRGLEHDPEPRSVTWISWPAQILARLLFIEGAGHAVASLIRAGPGPGPRQPSPSAANPPP